MPSSPLRSLLSAVGLAPKPSVIRPDPAPAQARGSAPSLRLGTADWRQRLSPAQFHVLREEGTERPHSSALNREKRAGVYACAGCGTALFSSDMKFNSGTGWPSFFTTLPGAFATTTDDQLIFPRTEYHCAHCGGHDGHVFNDGPAPTGRRYCNNGVALTFQPAD